MLLCFVSLLSGLAGCGKKNPAEEAAKGLEQAWTLRSQDAQAVVGLRDGTPVLAYFGTLANGKNRVAEQALALPEARLVQGEKVPFAWRFVSGQEENGALTLKLRDEAGFSYELICRLDPDQRGPLQLEGAFTNETDAQIVYASDAILTAGLSFDQTATGWMFRKEGGVAEGVTLDLATGSLDLRNDLGDASALGQEDVDVALLDIALIGALQFCICLLEFLVSLLFFGQACGQALGVAGVFGEFHFCSVVFLL